MRKIIPMILCCALLLFWVSGALAQDNDKAPTEVNLHIRDYCDPASFDAALGTGACVRGPWNPLTNGAITITGFRAELALDKSAGAWRFAPDQTSLAEGGTLHITNLGGETHTFTEVKRFGGGFIAGLNAVSGNPVPAPECAQIVNGKLVPQPPSEDNLFILAGGSATVAEHQGVARYQCCIHPWMRLTISPRDEHHEEVH